MAISKKILIIDDELLVRKVISQVVVGLGMETITANDGIEGLEKIKSEKPDLVFMDFLMPTLNGLEIAEEVRKDSTVSHIPIVMISGKAEHNDVDRAEKLGIKHYISKPLNIKFLKKFVKEYFFQDDKENT